MKNLAAKYISNIEGALSNFEMDKKVYSSVKNYLADAKHYYAKGDYLVSIVCASYAEGLLDGYFMGKNEERNWEWASKKVVAVGTFDLIHAGHIEFLWEAKRYGRLYVIVARDTNVARAKGRPPIVPEAQRLKVIENLKPVDYAVLGDEKDFLKPIREIRPDIIILGPDEQYPVDKLKRELGEMGINAEVIKLQKRFSTYPLSSTSQIIDKIIDMSRTTPK